MCFSIKNYNKKFKKLEIKFIKYWFKVSTF